MSDIGINFHKDMRMAGYRPATFKNGLRGFERTRSPGSMIDLKSVFPQRRDGAIVFEECLDRRLIETQDGFRLAPGGEAMVRGKAKPRTPLAKAQALLDEFLARVHALNSDENAVRYVDEVWLFGSVLRGAEKVGDIDLALVTDRRPQYRIKGGYELMKARLKKVMANRDDVPQAQGFLWSAEHWVTERAPFGAKVDRRATPRPRLLHHASGRQLAGSPTNVFGAPNGRASAIDCTIQGNDLRVAR